MDSLCCRNPMGNGAISLNVCWVGSLSSWCLGVGKLPSGAPLPGLQGSVESGWADTESSVDIRAWSKPPCFAWAIFTGLRIRETGSSERGAQTDRKREWEDGERERQRENHNDVQLKPKAEVGNFWSVKILSIFAGYKKSHLRYSARASWTIHVLYGVLQKPA